LKTGTNHAPDPNRPTTRDPNPNLPTTWGPDPNANPNPSRLTGGEFLENWH